MSRSRAKAARPQRSRVNLGRRVFLVPFIETAPYIPSSFTRLLDRYWEEARSLLDGHQRVSGEIRHIYHEGVWIAGEEGLRIVERINPQGHPYLSELCRSTAVLEATERRRLFEESQRWRNLAPKKPSGYRKEIIAKEHLEEANRRRYAHIASVMDSTLGEGELALGILSLNHGLKFPEGVRPIHWTPNTLEDIVNWVNEHWKILRAEGMV